MQISKEDMNLVLNQVIAIQSLMGEISLCTDKDVKDLIKYYTKPSKSLPYHNKWKRYNSPQTFIAGTLNNIMMGNQQDLSETQAQHLQNIISNFSGFHDALKEMRLDLQKNNIIEPIMFVENIWSSQ